jgi:hypothetical protein
MFLKSMTQIGHITIVTILLARGKCSNTWEVAYQSVHQVFGMKYEDKLVSVS